MKKKLRIVFITVVFCFVIYIIDANFWRIGEKIYDRFYPPLDITYEITQDAISYTIRNSKIVCLTSKGELYEYDNNGEMTKVNQSDVSYIPECGDFFIIKTDGSIWVDVNDNYQGRMIGSIPGAKSGCLHADKFIYIVTEDGELFYKSIKEDIVIGEHDIKQSNGWYQAADIKDVQQVYMNNSYIGQYIVLTKQGQVWETTYFENEQRYQFRKIFSQKEFEQMTSNGRTILCIDSEGNVYQHLVDIDWIVEHERYVYITDFQLMKREHKIKKVSIDYFHGAEISEAGDVFVWFREKGLKNGGLILNLGYKEIATGPWEDVRISDYLYLIKDNTVRVMDYKRMMKHELNDWS